MNVDSTGFQFDPNGEASAGTWSYAVARQGLSSSDAENLIADPSDAICSGSFSTPDAEVRFLPFVEFHSPQAMVFESTFLDCDISSPGTYDIWMSFEDEAGNTQIFSPQEIEISGT